MRHLWRRQRKPFQLTGGFVEACEQIVSGRTLEAVAGTDQAVPDWFWVNTLAHASREQLEAIAARSDDPALPKQAEPWLRTVAFLAGEVLSRADANGTDALELQRAVIVPIELAMGDGPIGPSTLVRRVLTGLANHSVSR